jgi:hypothetical protein
MPAPPMSAAPRLAGKKAERVTNLYYLTLLAICGRERTLNLGRTFFASGKLPHRAGDALKKVPAPLDNRLSRLMAPAPKAAI